MEAIKLIEKKCHNKHDIEFLSLHLYRVQVQARSKIENNGGNLSNYFLNTQYITFVFCWVENVVEKDKCWLPDFFFFLQAFFPIGVKSRQCVVKD